MLEAYARRLLAEMAADSSAHADAAAVLADAETFAASENSGDFAAQVRRMTDDLYHFEFFYYDHVAAC
jgi:hypothetical protein